MDAKWFVCLTRAHTLIIPMQFHRYPCDALNKERLWILCSVHPLRPLCCRVFQIFVCINYRSRVPSMCKQPVPFCYFLLNLIYTRVCTHCTVICFTVSFLRILWIFELLWKCVWVAKMDKMNASNIMLHSSLLLLFILFDQHTHTLCKSFAKVTLFSNSLPHLQIYKRNDEKKKVITSIWWKNRMTHTETKSNKTHCVGRIDCGMWSEKSLCQCWKWNEFLKWNCMFCVRCVNLSKVKLQTHCVQKVF